MTQWHLQDHEVIKGIEKHKQSHGEIIEVCGDEEKLGDPHRISAVKSMLTAAPSTEEYVRHQLGEIKAYQNFRDSLIKYALTRDLKTREKI